MKINTNIFFIYVVFFSYNIQAQNLVPNPSFENYNMCPESCSGMAHVKDWQLSKYFSSDYFNRCVNRIPKEHRSLNMAVPVNVFGYQEPRTGNAYAGVIYSREAIQTKLIEPLIKDSIYYVSFFVNLADSSTYAVWKIGAFITNAAIVTEYHNYKKIFKCKPQILNDKNNYITDKENWTEISGKYKAKGGEQYLLISSFCYNDQPVGIKILVPNKKLKRHYYIDDVSVTKVNCQNVSDNNILKAKLEQGKTILLSNIFFKTNKSELLPKSFVELNKLLKIMNDNTNIAIEIIGHTDNVGAEKYNLKLSEARAKSVADYLINKGIKRKRIKYKGYGSSHPITDNNSEQGRMKNRRVEFKILKK